VWHEDRVGFEGRKNIHVHVAQAGHGVGVTIDRYMYHAVALVRTGLGKL
jgi:hypothetical protein